MHLRLLRIPSLTQIIYKEVTSFFQIMQIVISTALYIQHANQGFRVMDQKTAYRVQVRK